MGDFLVEVKAADDSHFLMGPNAFLENAFGKGYREGSICAFARQAATEGVGLIFHEKL